jgi:ubiquinone/menaquinone biosynthesis C-methylase UbiE
MRLSDREFRAMNNPFRRFLQRHVEFPTFRRMGLEASGKDVLEIGCGSGYGAVLLSSLRPRSYVGIDLMPEQIDLARRIDLEDAAFHVMDATDLAAFEDASKDLVVIFGILHHVPRWSQVIKETRRVLRTGGEIYLEEPSELLIRPWDGLFKWGHPSDAQFRLAALELELQHAGFELGQRRKRHLFGYYRAVAC